MVVTHILRDGTIIPDIKGYIVQKEDAKGIYDLIERINMNVARKGGAK